MNVSLKGKLKIVYQILLMVLVTSVLVYRDLLGYGMGQLAGQINVLNAAQPIEEVLADTSFPDSLKVKLRQVQEIKDFAIREIGLNGTNNYTSVVNQKGTPILWVITAAQAFSLEDYTWTFPLLGEVGYKGFFDFEKANAEASILKEEGFDVGVREVTAWSTLGFFDDPILTNFLNRSEGSLASLIIHEMTHGTMFIKDNLEFNENLANFIGDEGAIRYMEFKYGKNSKEVTDCLKEQSDQALYVSHMLKGAGRLDSLYLSFDKEISDAEKKRQKLLIVEKIMNELRDLTFNSPQRYHKNYSAEDLPNNTFFLSLRRYSSKQNIFKIEFENEYNADFKAYFETLKQRYSSI